MDFTLTGEEQRILIQTARESIESRLFGRAPQYPPATESLKKKMRRLRHPAQSG